MVRTPHYRGPFMSGLMAFHAHPDDEVTSTGGTLARYAARGEQLVVVTATDGAEGEVHNYDDPDDVKARLAEVRREEIAAALSILGVKHHEFLGYRDSGMMGEPSNDHPESFWKADLMEATKRLIGAIRRHRPEVLVIYDPFGGYGHPDHLNVHRIGMAAWYGIRDHGRFPLGDEETDWVPQKLYWTVSPRSRSLRFAEHRRSIGEITDEQYERAQRSGIPDDEVTTWIDVGEFVPTMIEAWRAHRSQIPEDWFFLALPEKLRDQALQYEAYLRVFSRVPAPDAEDDLLAGLR